MDAKTVEMERQLYRLENFVDVGYAMVIVLIVFNLPAARDWADQGLNAYIQVSLDAIALPALVIVIVLIYWMQNNNLLGKLAATDNVHSPFRSCRSSSFCCSSTSRMSCSRFPTSSCPSPS